MSLTATSTEFLLLQQQVNNLPALLNGQLLIGSLILTVLVALFIAAQFFSYISQARRIADGIIKRETDALREELTMVTKETKTSVTAEVEDIVSKAQEDFKDNLDKMSAYVNTSHGRTMALVNEQDQSFEPAFVWWLWAAFWYQTGKDPVQQEVVGYIESARQALLKSKVDKIPQDQLESINQMLDGLSEKYTKEISEIREILMKQKNTSSKKESKE